MAYVLALVLVAFGVAAILGRRWATKDLAKLRSYGWPFDMSRPATQRLNSLGIAVFGVIFIGVGLYIAALAARIAP